MAPVYNCYALYVAPFPHPPQLNVQKVYPLADAARAHDDIEGRKTTGKLLLDLQA